METGDAQDRMKTGDRNTSCHYPQQQLPDADQTCETNSKEDGPEERNTPTTGREET